MNSQEHPPKRQDSKRILEFLKTILFTDCLTTFSCTGRDSRDWRPVLRTFYCNSLLIDNMDCLTTIVLINLLNRRQAPRTVVAAMYIQKCPFPYVGKASNE